MARIKTTNDLCNSWGTCDTCKIWSYILRQYSYGDLCSICWEQAHIEKHLWGYCDDCHDFTYLLKENNNHRFCPGCLEHKRTIIKIPLLVIPALWECNEIECHLKNIA